MTEIERLPVRVVRVITRLNIGGPSIQAITLSQRLRARGFETLLIHGSLGAGEGDMTYVIDQSAKVETRLIPALQRPVSPLNDLRALIQIFSALRRYKPAVVHTHMAKAGALTRLAALAYNWTSGRRRPARVVHTYHGHVLEGYFTSGTTNLFITLERLLARCTDTLIAISPTIKEELLRLYKIGRDEQYRVVPLGFDLSPFAHVGAADRAAAREALDLAADALVVTTVGRLTAIKQHDLFLEAASRVLGKRSDVVFMIAGDGELRADLEAHARRLRIARHVRFLGWRRDLPALYAASDLFALTSRNEGTPVALIESMAAGVPGVCTDVGGVRDVLSSDELGMRVPDGDPDTLARAILTLLMDPARRTAMGARGRASVLERYGIERLVADIDHVYRTLLA